jgi:hypothetical protein
MAGFNAQKHWWIVIVAVAVVGIAALLITDQWMPGNSVIGDLLFFALIGPAFARCTQSTGNVYGVRLSPAYYRLSCWLPYFPMH